MTVLAAGQIGKSISAVRRTKAGSILSSAQAALSRLSKTASLDRHNYAPIRLATGFSLSERGLLPGQEVERTMAGICDGKVALVTAPVEDWARRSPSD